MNLDYDNYVFDLYGTLFDIKTDEQAAVTWKKWCRYLDKQGIKHPEYYKMRCKFFDMDKESRIILKKESGCDVPEIDIINVYRQYFQDFGNPLFSDDYLNELAYAFRLASRSRIKLYPGVEEYLKNLKENGKKLYLLSNAQKSYTMPEIIEYGLDKLLDGILISSDIKAMKPDIRFYEALISKYSLQPDRTVMTGDNYENDVEAAKKAGLSAIWLSGEKAAERYYLNELCN